jgi:hypothetical protein
LISTSAIVSINLGTNLILENIGQCDVTLRRLIPIKTITSVLMVLTYIIINITALLIGLLDLHYHQYHSSSYRTSWLILSSVSQLFLSDFLTYLIISITALLIGLVALHYRQYHSSSYRTCCVTLSSVSQLFLSDLLRYIIVSITGLLIRLVALLVIMIISTFKTAIILFINWDFIWIQLLEGYVYFLNFSWNYLKFL